MNKIEELEKKYKELGEEIEKLKAEKENEPWRPKVGNSYWYIDNDGVVNKTEWTHFGIHRRRYLIGNVFKTEEQAGCRVGQLRVEEELRRFARPFEEKEQNVILKYTHDTNKLITGHHLYSQYGNIYFASEEIARKAIDTVGSDRIKKYYFGVEE